jgi:hypothetical protein
VTKTLVDPKIAFEFRHQIQPWHAQSPLLHEARVSCIIHIRFSARLSALVFKLARTDVVLGCVLHTGGRA